MDITNGRALCSLCPASGIRYEQVAAGGSLDCRTRDATKDDILKYA
jgi:hypothetical protein